MSPIQQMLLGVGAVAEKTYIDDIFSTYLWAGSGSARSINNGVNLSEKGGLVWIKNRTATENSGLFDTLRGAGKWVVSNSNSAEDTDTNRLSAFNNNGFSLGSDTMVNNSNATYASWTFARSKGFFDCITFSGDGNLSRQISHNLECKPGMVLLKRTDGQYGWYIWHRGLNGGDNSFRYFIRFDYEGQTDANSVSNSPIQAVSSTTVTLSASSGWDGVNTSGQSYVMYVFAGGEEQGNASVKFKGSDGYLKLNSSSNWSLTGQFCLEYWVYMTANNVETPTISWGSGAYRALFWSSGNQYWRFQWPTGNSNVNMGGTAPTNTWKHHVLTRDSNNVLRFFIDGELIYNTTETDNMGASEDLFLGYKANSTTGMENGNLSNVRIVNGSIPTTYQTSSTTNGASIFTSPTSPLSTTSQGATASDVKLLCCNDIGASGFTKSPSSIIGVGSPEGNKTNSPFAASTATDASAVFGDSGSESVIKCGSYKGNNNSDGPEVNLGFEPSFLILKESSDNGNHWRMYDSMRGIASSDNDAELYPSSGQEEDPNNEFLELTPTGFKLKTSDSAVNDNQTYIYLAVRRPDGYVGKPIELGTDVFAMDTGNSSSTIPTFDSGFPVDFAMVRANDSSNNWETCARLIGKKYLTANTNGIANSGGVVFTWDSNVGWLSHSSYDSTQLSWMWKRHAGMDVVTYKGDGVAGRQISHSMNKAVEMLWVKTRDSTENWIVGHKGLNGGSSPWDHEISLNETNQEANNVNKWNDTAPTSTHFTVGDGDAVNKDDDHYIALLFSSVNGISKVGYFSGDGTSNREITTGFQPRLLIIRKVTSTASWSVLDTKRGWTNGGAQPVIDIESSNGQANRSNWFSRNSTSFTIVNSDFNDSSEKYIYYAHA